MIKKVCVFTGTRAEYGLLKPLMKLLKKDPDFKLQIIASGMHLSPEFGLTYKEIEKDCFEINEKIEILLSSDTSVAINKSIGLGLISFSEAIKRLSPDIAVVLGDRYETFAFSIASFISNIPIIHLHGGELTIGAFDDGLRHSITKMSSLHFTSTDNYRKRVIQLGESPKKVFSVGAIGLDNINNLKLLSKQELEKKIKFKFKKRNILVTFHPVTLEDQTAKKQFSELLNVLGNQKDMGIIFTKANSDTDGRIINKMIDEYAATSKNAIAFTSMGQLRYLSTMQYVDAVVGNSSSGIIEAPSFKIGTINIGDRQKGRVQAQSVLNSEPNAKSIEKAFEKLYSNVFQERLIEVKNPYGEGGTAPKIIKLIKSQNLEKILKKKFFDIDFSIDSM